MARLTAEQWSEIRAEWEASPKVGVAWLAKESGGRWDVTRQAIHLRRTAERWLKRGTLAGLVEKAQLAADVGSSVSGGSLTGNFTRPLTGSSVKNSEPAPVSPESEAEQSGAAEQIAVDLRAKLIERHRAEWGLARQLVYDAAKAKDFDRAKLGKITSEALRIVQEGERKAWGLDALNGDVASMTDEQLEQIARGKMPR